MDESDADAGGAHGRIVTEGWGVCGVLVPKLSADSDIRDNFFHDNVRGPEEKGGKRDDASREEGVVEVHSDGVDGVVHGCILSYARGVCGAESSSICLRANSSFF